ncbi:MAG TPA: hypothetical protein VH276_14395 [Solirubrobacteraceae bacterium]|nr:hypothetical protein [Solirubrobacteraceae bacterium]
MAEPAEVYRRRRLVALGALLGAVVVVVAVTALLSGGGGSSSQAARESPKLPPPPPQLPRGGREILPRYRVVAYYGAPQDVELGALGIGRPDQAVARLEKQAKPYAAGGRPVMPVLELIAVVAAHDPGGGGRYNLRQPDSVIRRYLAAARRAKALLVLDIQPGRSDFFTEATRLRKWLRQPDVGLALDPEWRVTDSQVPGQVIGRVDSRELDATTAWLSQLITRNRLPQKLVIIHQFTDDMVDETALQARAGEAIVLNADGFGTRPVKVSKYKRFTRQAPGFEQGFKLFYKEDVGMMTPRQVLRLKPPPDVVVYE